MFGLCKTMENQKRQLERAVSFLMDGLLYFRLLYQKFLHLNAPIRSGYLTKIEPGIKY